MRAEERARWWAARRSGACRLARSSGPAVPLLALSAIAALAGCGSSGSATAPSRTTALTHSELVARADAICSQANARIAALKPPPSGGLPYREVARLLAAELPPLSAELNVLESLDPPAGDQEAFTEYLRAVAAELASLGRVRAASAARDANAYRGAALELVTSSTRAVQGATHLGLIECAKRPEPKG
jgi:hypothetical protein